MPSPFPGMDPYLEGSEWTSVRSQLIAEIARQLAPRLRPRYIARTEKRFVFDTPDAEEGVAVSTAAGTTPQSIYPDVGVAQTPTPATGGGGAVVVLPAPLEMLTVMPEPVPQSWVEIRDTAERQLVTVIEVLSPANKRGDGEDEYLERRRRLLASSAHLMEIDLLRSGHRVPMRQPLPPQPYFVFLSRAGRRPRTEVWPVAIHQPLPTVPVPLRHGDADVPLNLQQALATVYDLLGYDLSVDYTRPPEVPLRPEDAAWVRDHLGIPRTPKGSG